VVLWRGILTNAVVPTLTSAIQETIMRPLTHSIRRATLAAGVAVLFLLPAAPGGNGPRFFADDPVWQEHDTQNASNTHYRQINLFYDLAENLFAGPGDDTPNVRAQNINTIDEVPDSNWYVNRAGRVPLTIGALLKGPDTTNGPAPGPWTIVSAKSDGVMPGFTIRDSAGIVWFIKVDPPGHAGMATGTEVVVTKLFWALGYHVTEVHLAQMRREDLTIAEDAKMTPPGGGERRLRPSDIDSALRHAARDPDGSYPVIASKRIEGRRLGGFLFFGTRSDDPNDYVPHEHRRELRGYGTFSAWLNHVDSKSINTFDTLIGEGERATVKHYLLDFGSTLGSAGVYPRERFEGSEYLVDGKHAMARIATLGFYVDKWRTMPMHRSPSVGAFPSDNRNWDPDRWKPRIPNAAFVRARRDDKFWAARKLQAITPAMLTEIVKLGRFGNERSELAIAKFLIERREAILRKYLVGINPIVDPNLEESGALTFSNVAVDARVASAPSSYQVNWFHFDNATGQTKPLGETTASEPRVQMPSGVRSTVGTYVKTEIRAIGGADPSWADPIDVYFVREANGWKLVGLERMPDGNAPTTSASSKTRVAN
jgi:hypothetical protein